MSCGWGAGSCCRVPGGGQAKNWAAASPHDAMHKAPASSAGTTPALFWKPPAAPPLAARPTMSDTLLLSCSHTSAGRVAPLTVHAADPAAQPAAQHSRSPSPSRCAYRNPLAK